jgi:hypothetical protein
MCKWNDHVEQTANHDTEIITIDTHLFIHPSTKGLTHNNQLKEILKLWTCGIKDAHFMHIYLAKAKTKLNHVQIQI